MQIFDSVEKVTPDFKRCVVAVGFFDGVHIGHQKVIKRSKELARRLNAKSLVLTFEPHPLKLFPLPSSQLRLLTSLAHKLKLLQDLGVDGCLVVKFTKSFARTTPLGFVRKILAEGLTAQKVCVGPNFTFGRNKSGDVGTLKKIASRFGVKVEVIKPAKANNQIVSSSLLRSFIARGELEKANRCLDRRFSIFGKVVKGKKRGRLIGYPTANIKPYHEVIPPGGVYSVKVRWSRRIYSGILNIGKRPTFGDGFEKEPTVEAHIFDFDRQLYGEELEIFFGRKIREERKFAGKEDLIRQIKKDERLARRHSSN